MAIKDEIKQQTDKLKDMSGKEKIEYIWTYYKWWIICTVFLIVFITSTAKTIIRNSKPVYLYAAFLNTSLGPQDDDCTLEEGFREAYGVDPKEYNMSMDYVIYLDNDYGNQSSYTGQVKLISMYQAEQLDIVCAQESVLNGSADVGGYTDLSEVLPDGMLDDLINRGYEPYYYTEKIYDDNAVPDENGNTPYTEGDKYIAGICINNSKKLVGNGSSCVYRETGDDKWILTIAWNSKNIDHAIEFLQYVTED